MPTSPAKPKKRKATAAEKRQAWYRQQQAAGPGIFVALETPNPLNNAQGYHHGKAAQRKRRRQVAELAVRSLANRPPLPVQVKLTRYSAGTLDAWDGLRAALKNVLDGVADAYGVADNDPRFQPVEPQQEKAPPRCHGVRIELQAA